MDLYPWLVFVHVVSVILAFLGHGASAATALRLRSERDPVRIAALLDLSQWSLTAAGVGILVVLVSGIVAGIVRGWWGQGWIWLSLVLFVVVGGLMTPLGGSYLNQVRRAVGVPTRDTKGDAAARPLEPAELEVLLRSPKPMQVAALGIAGLVVITWLMMFKPF